MRKPTQQWPADFEERRGKLEALVRPASMAPLPLPIELSDGELVTERKASGSACSGKSTESHSRKTAKVGP